MAEVYNPGFDYSGNDNDWTPTNINYTTSTSVTYARMSDVPTLTDEDTANFATINPLDMATMATQSANLFVWNQAGGSWQAARGTIGVSSGKWYWEAQADSNTYLRIGVALQSASLTSTYSNPTDSWTYVDSNGNKTGNGSETSYGASYANGDTIGIALDMDAGTLTFYKNGSSQGVAFNTGLSGKEVFPLFAGYNTNRGFHANFGQRPFAYTPPTGYKKLNTYNLPDSDITDGSDHFAVNTYTGNNTTNVITTGFSPDLVWIKVRNTTGAHGLTDTVRGRAYPIFTNYTDGDGLSAADKDLVSFDATGFTLGIGNQYNSNGNGDSLVAWSWRGSDSAAVTNTDGALTSQVSANPTSGFSIATYTGNGTTTTVGHGLGTTPKVLIMKNRDISQNWHFYTTALDGSLDYFNLNSTAAKQNSGLSLPSSSVFSVGSSTSGLANDYVAYCFAEVEGFSKFGSYTGNGSSNGPFVYTGFRPAFVLIKRTDTTNSWGINDSSRNLYNPTQQILWADLTNADEDRTARPIDLLSNGFKIKTTESNCNASGGTYIYMAFAENPFKNSLAR